MARSDALRRRAAAAPCVDGRGYVGGDLSGHGAFMQNPHDPAAPGLDGLYVAGSVLGTAKVHGDAGVQVAGDARRIEANFGGGSGAEIRVGGALGGLAAPDGARVHVGGAATGLTMNNGAALRVGGGLTHSTLNNVDAVIGGPVANVTANNSALAVGAPAAPALSIPDAAGLRSLFERTSADLSALAAARGRAPAMAGSAAVFEGDGELAVFDVTSAEFNAWTGIRYALEPDETLVINVSVAPGGPQPRLNANPEGIAGSAAARVLWNFETAADLGLARKLVGAVIAPRAEIRQLGGSHEGTLVAERVALPNGEVHDWGHDGWLAQADAQIPLPPALPLSALGLAALAALRARRAR
jgi:choice-of-anchor A domain-containing protein